MFTAGIWKTDHACSLLLDSWLVVHISKTMRMLVGSPSFVGSGPTSNPTEVEA